MFVASMRRGDPDRLYGALLLAVIIDREQIGAVAYVCRLAKKIRSTEVSLCLAWAYCAVRLQAQILAGSWCLGPNSLYVATFAN